MADCFHSSFSCVLKHFFLWTFQDVKIPPRSYGGGIAGLTPRTRAHLSRPIVPTNIRTMSKTSSPRLLTWIWNQAEHTTAIKYALLYPRSSGGAWVQRTVAMVMRPSRRSSPSCQQLGNEEREQEKQEYVAEEKRKKALTVQEVDSHDSQENAFTNNPWAARMTSSLETWEPRLKWYGLWPECYKFGCKIKTDDFIVKSLFQQKCYALPQESMEVGKTVTSIYTERQNYYF